MKVGSAQVGLTLSSSWASLVSKCTGMCGDTVLIPRALCKLEFHPFYHNYNLNSIDLAHYAEYSFKPQFDSKSKIKDLMPT